MGASEVIADNWRRVRASVDEAAIAAGRSPESVRLVAVSKLKPAEAVVAAYEAGARDFGENYQQEMSEKQAQVKELIGASGAAEIRWHFIGHLQSRKVRQLSDVHLLHALDRASLVKAVRKREDALPALVQVRLGAEESKSGVDPGEVVARVGEWLEAGLSLRGLMAIPPPMNDDAAQRAHFDTLASLLAQCREAHGAAAAQMTELSMGMSADFPLAIAAGATLVRVGTAIFGSRSK